VQPGDLCEVGILKLCGQYRYVWNAIAGGGGYHVTFWQLGHPACADVASPGSARPASCSRNCDLML